MALVLDATAGGPSANSYATVAEGTSYHEGRLHSSAWTDASATDKAAALVWATRLLDGTFAWAGWPDTSSQALQWPRSGIVARNPFVVVPEGVVPQEIKNATAELARLLITSDRASDSDLEVQGITSVRAGSVALTFSGSASRRVVPSALYDLIPSHWYTASSARSGVRDLVRA
jgi:hypothetical protein